MPSTNDEPDDHRPYSLLPPCTWAIWLVVTIVIACLIADMQWVHRPLSDLTGLGLGLLFVTRDVRLGQQVSRRRALAFAILLILALAAAATGQGLISVLASLIACIALLGSAAAPLPAEAEERRFLWSLIDRTTNDTLAPFALRTDKSCIVSPDGRAAIAYRVCLGTAVASGDPVGDAASHKAAIEAFCAHAESQGWRYAALGASPRQLDAWRAHGLWTLSIGRDVIIDIAKFSMLGRPFLNLRQAVQHTHNCGVTTQIIPENKLDAQLRDELGEVLRRTPQGTDPRGFVMILDRPLTSVHPGTFIAIARNKVGRIVACQRYATADAGRELTLDLPWRLRDAPNGVDERLIVDTIAWGRQRGTVRVSLSFAPFPDLFSTKQRTPTQQILYWTVHRLDRFIQLESLFRFLRKFHAFGDHRYVAMRRRHLLPVAAAMLVLEFGKPRTL